MVGNLVAKVIAWCRAELIDMYAHVHGAGDLLTPRSAAHCTDQIDLASSITEVISEKADRTPGF